MALRKLFIPLTLLLILLPTACTDDESDLGINLQDPLTIYNGIRGTICPEACTMYDDSLSTTGYSAGIIGNYHDPIFGDVTATLYSQISLSGSNGISFADNVEIDSVTMTLVIDTVFPITTNYSPCMLHLVMKQLAEPVVTDSAYYSFSSLPVSSTTFFDGTVNYNDTLDSINVRLDESIYSVLKQNCSLDDFISITKGFSLTLASGAQTMATVNLAATATRITMYYHTPSTKDLRYNFIINSGAHQFMNYSHNYSGSVIQPLANHSVQSLAGNQKLYLEPMGGTKVRLNLQPFLDTFRIKHPTAVIHYAELIMPRADEADTIVPERLLAIKRTASGSSAYVTDANVLTNPYTYSGFDGYFNRDKQYYRLRITQHLQEMLRSGKDYGTDIIIDARRSTAFRTIINGYGASNPVRIEYIYTE